MSLVTDTGVGAELIQWHVHGHLRSNATVKSPDLPRPFVIRERYHRIHDPFSEEKLATLGRALRLREGDRILDLACGSGEMMCTWARDHQTAGTGVDLSSAFIADATARAEALGVSGRVTFEHGDASGYVGSPAYDVATCLGATWIGGGVAGTIELLERSLRPGGTVLIGEPYWTKDPPDDETVRGSHATSPADYRSLPSLVRHFRDLGWDLVEMVLANPDDWDRYTAAQWFSVRRFLDEHPDDELHAQMRAELDDAPLRHVTYGREYLGWGTFALMRR
jgi:SAM-dependent methyltransferase